MSVIDLDSKRAVPLKFYEEDKHWQEFDGKAEFLPLINPINYEFKTNVKTTEVMSRPVSFYKDGQFLKVEDKKWKEEWAIFYFLHVAGKYFQLGSDDTSNTIFKRINSESDLILNKNTVFDYLKLFSYFTVSDDGSFFLIESEESEFSDFIPYANELERQTIMRQILPPEIIELKNNEGFEVSCTTLSGDHLWFAKYYISPNGAVEMLDDEAL